MLVVLVYHVVVNTSQVRIEKDSSEDAYLWQGDYLHKAQAEENVCVYLFLSCLFVSLYVPLVLHKVYFICLWHNNKAYLCWKCQTPTNQIVMLLLN